MKAVLLAAGSGSRFKPFSLTKSKIMTEFLGKPLLFYHIDEFISNGITEAIIICNPENYGEIRNETIKAYPSIKTEFVIQKEQLGPSHAILCAKEFLNDDFILWKFADSIHSEDLVKPLLECFKKSSCDGAITLRKVDDPSRYGIARIIDEKVAEIVEKPESNPPSDLAMVGIGILKTELLLKGIEKDKLWMGKKEVAPPEYVLREGGRLNYWVYEGKREDLGKPWDVLLANKLLICRFGAKKLGSIHPTAKISDDCCISAESVIGSNCVITNYSSVSGRVEEETIIDGSVIMKGSAVGKNCRITSSVIGENNRIGDGFDTNAGKTTVFIKNKLEQSPVSVGIFTGSSVEILPRIKAGAGKIVYPNRKVSTDINSDRIIRAVIFDADNTLYDTKAVAEKADIAAMKYFSTQTRKSAEELYGCWREIIEKLKTERSPEKRHRMYSYTELAVNQGLKNVQEAFKAFATRLLDLLQPMQGITVLLPEIKHKMAIITEDSKDMVMMKLVKLGMRRYFRAIITSDKVSVMKPDSKYFESAIHELDVAPQECIVVGDNYEKDLAAAKAQGAITVLYGSQAPADYCITSYREFKKILDEH